MKNLSRSKSGEDMGILIYGKSIGTSFPYLKIVRVA